MWYGYDKQEPQLHTQAASKQRSKLQGQGQGPKAERLLADATQNGSWVGASDALFGELWLSGSRDSQRAAGVLCVGFDVEPRFGERPFTQGQQARELDLQMWMGAALREIIGSMTGWTRFWRAVGMWVEGGMNCRANVCRVTRVEV